MGDYHFYFKKRNTRNAPDGLYWAPFGSFYHYQFQNNIQTINTTNAQGDLLLDGHFNVIGLGVELGYQFVIRERFTIDLIFMGPSLSLYSAKLDLDGDISVDADEAYLEAIRDILLSRFPFLEDLVQDGSFSDSGAVTSMGPGLRYMIQFGYRF